MFKTLKEQWLDVKTAKPGKRFQNRYERQKGRRCSAFMRPFYLVLGAALFLTGIVLMPAPGPGFLLVFFGAGMLAEESLLAARVLDWAELKLRALFSWARRTWRHASAVLKALIAAFAASIAAAAGWIAYAIFFG